MYQYGKAQSPFSSHSFSSCIPKRLVIITDAIWLADMSSQGTESVGLFKRHRRIRLCWNSHADDHVYGML
jgi:hypothetical protein